MAGAGAKLFTDGSVLNAEQVNTYLMDQSIMRFATTTARDAAFGGAGEPTLAEGMTCYIDADNSIYVYDGSSWIKSVSASQPVGFVLLRTGTLSSTSTNFQSVFSSEFDNYRITLDSLTLNANGNFWVRMLSGSTPQASGGEYYWAYRGISSSNVSEDNANGGQDQGYLGVGTSGINNVVGGAVSCDLIGPLKSQRTFFHVIATGYNGTAWTGRSGIIEHNQIASFDGIQILTNAATTMTGQVRIYGYRNS